MKSNSVDEDHILAAAPEILNGVDLIYVDSLHSRNHVLQEILIFFKYLNVGGIMFFDDVDSLPYMAGKRKDNFEIEIENRQIKNLLIEIFSKKINTVSLSMDFGSTGLASMKKLTECQLNVPERPFRHRRAKLLHKVIRLFASKRITNITRMTPLSFLIDVTRYNQ